MGTAAGGARTWRAEWTAPSGHPVSTTFPTQAQADLFALRRSGAVVDVTPVLQPVLDDLPALALADGVRSHAEADDFAVVVEGAPARAPVERRLLDVVAGLRRTVVPAASPEFARALRARLVGA